MAYIGQKKFDRNNNPVTWEHIETATKMVLDGLNYSQMSKQTGWSKYRCEAVVTRCGGIKAIKSGKGLKRK